MNPERVVREFRQRSFEARRTIRHESQSQKHRSGRTHDSKNKYQPKWMRGRREILVRKPDQSESVDALESLCEAIIALPFESVFLEVHFTSFFVVRRKPAGNRQGS